MCGHACGYEEGGMKGSTIGSSVSGDYLETVLLAPHFRAVGRCKQRASDKVGLASKYPLPRPLTGVQNKCWDADPERL